MPPIREWLNKLWNIWTEVNAVAKAGVEELVARGRAAQLRGMLCGFRKSITIRLDILNLETNNIKAYCSHNVDYRK